MFKLINIFFMKNSRVGYISHFVLFRLCLSVVWRWPHQCGGRGCLGGESIGGGAGSSGLLGEAPDPDGACLDAGRGDRDDGACAQEGPTSRPAAAPNFAHLY